MRLSNVGQMVGQTGLSLYAGTKSPLMQVQLSPFTGGLLPTAQNLVQQRLGFGQNFFPASTMQHPVQQQAQQSPNSMSTQPTFKKRASFDLNPQANSSGLLSALGANDREALEADPQLSSLYQDVGRGIEGASYLSGAKDVDEQSFIDDHPGQAALIDATRFAPYAGAAIGGGKAIHRYIQRNKAHKLMEQNAGHLPRGEHKGAPQEKHPSVAHAETMFPGPHRKTPLLGDPNRSPLVNAEDDIPKHKRVERMNEWLNTPENNEKLKEFRANLHKTSPAQAAQFDQQYGQAHEALNPHQDLSLPSNMRKARADSSFRFVEELKQVKDRASQAAAAYSAAAPGSPAQAKAHGEWAKQQQAHEALRRKIKHNASSFRQEQQQHQQKTLTDTAARQSSEQMEALLANRGLAQHRNEELHGLDSEHAAVGQSISLLGDKLEDAKMLNDAQKSKGGRNSPYQAAFEDIGARIHKSQAPVQERVARLQHTPHGLLTGADAKAFQEASLRKNLERIPDPQAREQLYKILTEQQALHDQPHSWYHKAGLTPHRINTMMPYAKDLGIPIQAGVATSYLGDALRGLQAKYYGREKMQDWQDAARRIEGDFIEGE